MEREVGLQVAVHLAPGRSPPRVGQRRDHAQPRLRGALGGEHAVQLELQRVNRARKHLFERLGPALDQKVARVEAAGADQIHIDVMDGRFVPEITIGPVIVEAVKRVTRLPIDVHLMIVEPDRHLQAFVRAGATSITVHVEAITHLHRIIQQVKDLGVRAAVALNPATPLLAVEPVLPDLDMVLLNSSGQEVTLIAASSSS